MLMRIQGGEAEPRMLDAGGANKLAMKICKRCVRQLADPKMRECDMVQDITTSWLQGGQSTSYITICANKADIDCLVYKGHLLGRVGVEI